MIPSRLYFTSGVLAGATKDACMRSQEHRDAVFGTLLLSYSTIESFMNDLAAAAHACAQDSRQPKEIHQFSALAEQLERSEEALTKRIQSFAIVFTGLPVDISCAPFQDFELLRSTRNALVHSRPEVVTEVEPSHEQRNDRIRKIVRGLESRDLIDPPTYDRAWLEIVQDERVAKWAVRTLSNVVLTLEGMVMESGYRRDVELLARCILETVKDCR